MTDAAYASNGRLSWYRQADHGGRRSLWVSFLGWLFDGYETYALVLTANLIVSSLMPDTAPGRVPWFVGILLAVTLGGWMIGGVLGGLLTDYIGRKRTMMYSILVYALCAGLTALSQTYGMFILFRILTGVGMGAEWGSGASMVSERFPTAARGRALAVLQSGFGFGFLLATLVWQLLEPLGPEAWRYMYLVGVLPAFLVMYLRTKVTEPEAWVKVNERRRAARQAARSGGQLNREEHALTRFTWSYLWETPVLRRRMIATVCMSFATITAWWAVSTWVPRYGASVAGADGLDPAQWAIYMAIFYNVGGIIGYLAMGWLADAFGRKPTILGYFVGALVMIPVLFLLDYPPPLLLVVALVNGIFTLGLFAWLPIYPPELFPTSVRGSAISLIFNVTRLVAMIGPLIAGWLISTLGGIPIAATVIGLIYILGLVFTPIAGPETKGQPLPDVLEPETSGT